MSAPNDRATTCLHEEADKEKLEKTGEKRKRENLKEKREEEAKKERSMSPKIFTFRKISLKISVHKTNIIFSVLLKR